MALISAERLGSVAATSQENLLTQPDAQICRRCGAAQCTATAHGRIMQPARIGTEHYRELPMFTPIKDCAMNPDDPLKFYRYLQVIGLAPLAEGWMAQIRAGIRPEQIVFQASENLIVQQTPDHSSNVTGAESEAHLIAVLSNQKLFPWIADIAVAEENQPLYDAQVRIDDSHPIGGMLCEVRKIRNSHILRVDAKSSFEGVFTYYQEAGRSKKKYAWADRVRDGFWAINTNTGLVTEQLHTQMVILLLMTLGLFNQRGHWDRVLEHLDTEMVTAFRKQTLLVADYEKFFFTR